MTIHRAIAAVALVLAISAPAAAQSPYRSRDAGNGTTRFYREDGSGAGRAETRGNETRFYREDGRSAGRAVERDGSVQFYDWQGRREGR